MEYYTDCINRYTMGPSSNVVLINATPYDWVSGKLYSSWMDSWSFPAKIPSS